MDATSIREFCLSLPHTTEDVKWEHDLCFLIGGKMYAVLALDGATDRFSFKCTPERFEQLLELDGVVPAPYMARNKWVSLTRFDAVEGDELREAIREAYDLILAKLPKRVRESLT